MIHSIQFDLARGERLLWSGAPRRGLILHRTDVFQIPFAIVWVVFVLYTGWQLGEGDAPLIGVIFQLVFLLVGIHLLIGRFWFDALRRKRTSYGVTDERLIISSGVLRPALKSINLATLSDLTLDQHRDGTGTITFGPGHPFAWMYGGMSWPGIEGPPAFERIPDPKRVYDLIRDAQRSAFRQRAPA